MNKIMLFAIYNNIMEEEIAGVLKQNNVEGFSLIENIKGKGVSSGYHMGNAVFPDLNEGIIVVDSEEKIAKLKQDFASLKKKYPSEGMKIFILPVIETI